ncbi:MAG: hypothetical protein LBR56_06825, partial [Sporomusaceae bacterium]|nr:hypothetical protein [Sporomusaceae bacterium]
MRRKAREALWYIVMKLLKYNTPHFDKDKRKNSGAKWLELKGKFEGKRCFIIGSAPSVKQLDLTKLTNEYTFTCNKAFLLKDYGLKKSNFYTLSDIDFYEDFKEDINSNWAEYFFVSTRIPWDIAVNKLFYFRPSGAFMRWGYFQMDMQKPLATNDTVITQILQIAVYLGFKEII